MQKHANIPTQPRCHNTGLCAQNPAHNGSLKASRCAMAPWLSLCAGLSRVPGSRVHALRCERTAELHRACLRGRGGAGTVMSNKRVQSVCGRPAGGGSGIGSGLASRAAGPSLVALGMALALHGAATEPTPRAERANGRACIVQPSVVARLLAVGGQLHATAARSKRSAKISGSSARL